MNILRVASFAAALSYCGSATAGTLIVSGDLQHVSFTYEDNELILLAPWDANLDVTPQNLIGFRVESSRRPEQRIHRASFNLPPRFRATSNGNNWIFSDDVEGSPGSSTQSPGPEFGAHRTGILTAQREASSTEVQVRDKSENNAEGLTNEKHEEPAPPDTSKRAPIHIGNAKVELPAESTLMKRKFSADTAVPESPAAAVIGSSATLIRLNDASDATTQVLNFVDGDSNLRSGFSFSFRPYRVFVKPSLHQYVYGPEPESREVERGRMVRFLSRLDLSLAATVDEAKGSAKQGASLALGLSGYIFNNADARVLLSEKLVRKFEDLNQAPFPNPGAPQGTGNVRATEVTSQDTQAITEEVFESVWNNSYWAFGAAPRWRSATGNTGDFTYDGGAGWTTFAYGFEGAAEKLQLDFLEDKSQLLLHTSYRDRQQATDPLDSAKKIREDVWIVAAQLRIGANNLNVFGEYVWEKHSPANAAKYSTRTYYVGLEKRLATDLWLQLSIGSQKKEETNDSSALFRTALNYAFGNSIIPGRPE